MSTISLMFFALVAAAFAFAESAADQLCGKDYHSCSLSGVMTMNLPPVGPNLSNLYADLIQAVNPAGAFDSSQPVEAPTVAERQDDAPFCCAPSFGCLLLSGFGIPFCWDQFTTNYYFPDGSHGSVIAGNYTSASGTTVDLVYGDFERSDGTKGNIYSGAPTMMPGTTTMLSSTTSIESGASTAAPVSETDSSVSTMSSASETLSSVITEITLPSTTISVGTSTCGHCTFTIIPGLTGLPPAMATTSITSITPATQTSTISSQSFPLMTPTSNTTLGTGTASAGGSAYTSLIVFPPIFGNSALSAATIYRRPLLIFSTSVIMWVLNH